ncbi:MAG: hypothetical protein SNH63_00430 [Rikenellaceae bacterium]
MNRKLLVLAILVASAISVVGKSRSADFELPLVLDMVHHNPGEPLYESAYTNPETIKSMGYNGKVYFLFESPMLAINWRSVDKDILPKGSADREWVDAKAAQIRAMQAECDKAGLTTLAQSDLVLFPKRLVEKYNLADRMGDARDPEVERLIRAQIAEMFDQFPLLDGLVTRIGETYLHDAPFHVGAIKDKSNAETTIIPLLEILRDEICVKRGKLLIFRTWVSFDSDMDRYMKVSNSVEPHENLIISIKHCEGDFHRSNPFSKVIGAGRHRQIIEVQCAREYEGKGAYPHYVANGVIEGFEEHQTMPESAINSIREFALTKPELYAGVWTWTRGGGWGGPYIKDELWCDLNAWVVAQWASDPTQREEDIFNRYVVERMMLKGDDVAKFRRLALLSADAVVRGKNTIQSDIARWWTRDEGISWPSFSSKEGADRAVAQKLESLEMWREIIELAKEIGWHDEQTRTHVIGSCYYGYHLYEIYRVVVTMSVACERGDWAQVAELIDQYDVAWREYDALPSQYSQLATLYHRDYKRHIKKPVDIEVDKLRQQAEVKAAMAK